MNDRDKGPKIASKYHLQPHEAGFDLNSPRPPVLGEERSQTAPENTMERFRSHFKSSSPVPRLHSELEESCRPPSRQSRALAASPDCFSWHKSLHILLQDSDGVKLFLKYLEAEAPQHAEALHFWFACEGLKNHNEAEKIHRLVKLIYKTFFMKTALPINDELRRQITKNLKSPQCLDPPVTLFDEAQAQVEYLINKSTYPNFLKSDLYLQYLQSVQNPSSSSEDLSSESSSSSSNKDLANLASSVGPLPTLHEGLEFNLNQQHPLAVTPGTGGVSTGYQTPTVRLTKDTLLRSQKHRALDIRPRSETFAGIMYRCSGAHAAYNSYNPVSRQDSEIQSLSSHSDAKTESDNLSMAERSIDGRVSGRSRHKSREPAILNKETDMHQAFIPRTQLLEFTSFPPLDFQQHAAILWEKLEKVRKDQETKEIFQRKLKESDSVSSLDEKIRTDLPSQKLENALREKLQFQDDNDQDILDEHVSRVFSDHSLSISPGLATPKPPGSWMGPPPPRVRRKDKDAFSTFSSDSGNVHDFPEGMVKSRSIPEYAEIRGSCRRSSSKKTLTDLTDSGVSVVSESTSGCIPGPKDSRVLTWLWESDRSGRVSSGGAHAHSEMAVREGPGRKYGRRYGSRSNSLERNSVTGPAQPFMADPSMPLLPQPNTDIQLEEIRRRLTEDDLRNNSRSRQRPINKYYPEMLTQSGQSTLRKPVKPQRPTNFTVEELTTTVVFNFCDEQVPYRTKIPGSQITLRQFKEYLPKKGNYRYFFKTVCEDLSNQVTNEEVSNDSEVLPLWEGKVMAQVKQID